MAFDAFLKIEGYPGESTDDKHKDWIEILSFTHSIDQPISGTVSGGGARSSERIQHGGFNITKALDKTSPKLDVCCCKGIHIKTITLELCRATGDKQKYMSYVLTDSIISHMSILGQAHGDGSLPLEEVSFQYAKIDWTFTDTDNKTGKSKGDIKGSWDLVTNTGG